MLQSTSSFVLDSYQDLLKVCVCGRGGQVCVWGGGRAVWAGVCGCVCVCPPQPQQHTRLLHTLLLLLLVQDHLVVTLFLTMLVGAGGNAGNQSAIKVIRGLVGVGPLRGEEGLVGMRRLLGGPGGCGVLRGLQKGASPCVLLGPHASHTGHVRLAVRCVCWAPPTVCIDLHHNHTHLHLPVPSCCLLLLLLMC